VRCTGYFSEDGRYAHCSREQHAGVLLLIQGSQTYAHYLDGACDCGVTHSVQAPAAKVVPEAVTRKELVAEYDYRDQVGTLIYQVHRYRYIATKKKTFLVRRRDDRGNWQWGRGDAKRFLYRLPELLAADPTAPVYIAEGEADVDRLAGLGLVATCNDGGAGKFTEAHAEVLKGRVCVVLQDNDAPGLRHAQQVADLLHPVAKSVKVVPFPELDEHGDVSDWLDAGHNVGDLETLVSSTPAWSPEATSEYGLRLTPLQDIQAVSVPWLWPARIPAGRVTIIFGPPESGKTHLVQDICTTVTRGAIWPDNGAAPLTGNVLFYTGEDGHADTIRPRFDAMGADISRITLIEPMVDDEGGATPLSVEKHAVYLEEAIRSSNAAVVVLDPLMAVFGAKADSNNVTDVRQVLGALGRIAEATGCSILAIMHNNKSAGFGDPMNWLSGSHAFGAFVRSMLYVGKHPEDGELRVVVQPKSNLGPHAPSLGFRISDSGVSWESGPLDITTQELVPGATTTRAFKTIEAGGFLQGLLADGPVPSTEVNERAKAAGLSDATVKRAKADLDVLSFRMSKGNGGDGSWYWCLPDHLPCGAGQSDHLANSDAGRDTSTPVHPRPRKMVTPLTLAPDEPTDVAEHDHLAGASLNSDAEQMITPPIRKMVTSMAPRAIPEPKVADDPWDDQMELFNEDA